MEMKAEVKMLMTRNCRKQILAKCSTRVLLCIKDNYFYTEKYRKKITSTKPFVTISKLTSMKTSKFAEIFAGKL